MLNRATIEEIDISVEHSRPMLHYAFQTQHIHRIRTIDDSRA